MEKWIGNTELIAIPMTEFDLILGQPFKVGAMASAFSHLRKLLILHPDYSCMVDFMDPK